LPKSCPEINIGDKWTKSNRGLGDKTPHNSEAYEMMEDGPQKKYSDDRKSIKLDPAIHREIKIAAAIAGEEIGQFIEKLWSARGSLTTPIPATCPICKTELLVSPAFVGIESVPGTAEAMMIPPDLRDEIEEFIRFSVSPIVPDIEWRNMMLALFRERAAKRRAGGK